MCPARHALLHGSSASCAARPCQEPTTLGVNTRPSWSVRPTVIRRSTISSRAELEGAQTWGRAGQRGRDGWVWHGWVMACWKLGGRPGPAVAAAGPQVPPNFHHQAAPSVPAAAAASPAPGPWGRRCGRCAAGWSGAAGQRRRWSRPALEGPPPPCDAQGGAARAAAQRGAIAGTDRSPACRPGLVATATCCLSEVHCPCSLAPATAAPSCPSWQRVGSTGPCLLASVFCSL